MSDEMIPVRSEIPSYAGFADAHARRLADQQVRAWMGERLAALRERLPLGAAADAFEELIFHCEFGDQHVIKALEDSRFGEPVNGELIEAHDGEVVAAGAGAAAVDESGLAAFVSGASDALRRRNDAILSLKR